jgi:hypothetical protein
MTDTCIIIKAMKGGEIDKLVNTGELETYLNAKSCKQDDVVEILGEGSFEEKKDTQTGKTKKVLNLPVKVNGKDLIYTPAKKAMETLQKAWGMDTKAWIGKKFVVKFVLMVIGSNEYNVIKPSPIEVKKV